MAEKHGLTFDVLSDRGNGVAAQYGIVFRLADEMIKLYRRGASIIDWLIDYVYIVPGGSVLSKESTITNNILSPSTGPALSICTR